MHTKLFIFLCIHLPYYMSMPNQWKIYMNTVETMFCFNKIFFMCYNHDKVYIYIYVLPNDDYNSAS